MFPALFIPAMATTMATISAKKLSQTTPKFISLLEELTHQHKCKFKYLSKKLGMNEAYISHLLKGKITSIRPITIAKMASILSFCAVQNNSALNRKQEEATIYRNLISSLEIPTDHSISEDMYRYQFTDEYPFCNSNFILAMIQDIKSIGYSSSEFIQTRVNSKSVISYIDYDGANKDFILNSDNKFDINYLEKLVNLDAPMLLATTFAKMSVLLYCYYELLQEKKPSEFHSKYNAFLSPEITLEENLQSLTYNMLFTVEYPTRTEFNKWFDDEDDDENDYNIDVEALCQSMSQKTDTSPYLRINEALFDLNEYQKTLGNNSFLETLEKNLCCETYDFVVGIFGNDFIKIEGACNRANFITDLKNLISKYTK